MKAISILIALFLVSGNLLLMSQNTPGHNKRALIVAIGDYQPETFWAKINSVNDIGLIRGVLNKQGFTNENILVIQDAEATLQGIQDAFEKLTASTGIGDYVVVHFSCHGQQITDDNGDEADGLDEAMVPFGAPANNTGKWANYRGELHLRDDAIGEYITRIRGRAGSKGQVLLTIDACHSGTASRGSDVFRGGAQAMQLKNIAVNHTKTESGLGMMESATGDGLAPFVVISACSFDERNKETYHVIDNKRVGAGSLSVAMAKVFADIDPGASYEALFATLKREMMLLAPQQSPSIEGDMQYKIFNGETVKQQPYFEIDAKGAAGHVIITGGAAMGLQLGDSIGFYGVGINNIKNVKPEFVGIIVNIFPFTAVVQLSQAARLDNIKAWWAFRTYASLTAQTVFSIDAPLPENVKASLHERFKNNPFIAFDTKGEYVITSDATPSRSQDNQEIVIVKNDDGLEIVRFSKIQLSNIDELEESIANIAQADFLRKLNFSDNNYRVVMKLLPAEITKNHRDEVIKVEAKGEESDLMTDGELKLGPDDIVCIEVKNTGLKPAYFSIIEIMPDGSVAPVAPCDKSPNAEEFKLEPGETRVLQEIAFEGFAPPYGKNVYKVFASSKALNLRPIVNTRGTENTKGSTSVVENIVGASFFGTSTRGGNKTMAVSSNDDTGSTYDYVITIIP